MDDPTPRLLGATQRPFNHQNDPLHRPEWLGRATQDPVDEARLSGRWQALLAHVANTANESGFFEPSAVDWLVWSALSREGSRRLADRLLDAGALRRVGDRLYVAGWRETYRLPDSPSK